MDREYHRDRQNQEDDRNHHRDLTLAAFFHAGAATGLTDVLCLCAQNVSQGCAAFDCDHDSVHEPREAGQPGAIGKPLQRGREVGSGAGIGEALAQLGGEVTLIDRDGLGGACAG